MKVLSVVGNRPQFIKAAPTSVALRERGIDEIVLHTGQHYDAQLSQVFFEELGLEEPRYALDLRTADTSEMRAARTSTTACVKRSGCSTRSSDRALRFTRRLDGLAAPPILVSTLA